MKLSFKMLKQFRQRGPATRAVLVFILMGVVWALLTDYLVGSLVADVHSFVRYEIIKAWIFIGLAGVVLYRFIRSDFHNIERVHHERQQALEQ